MLDDNRNARTLIGAITAATDVCFDLTAINLSGAEGVLVYAVTKDVYLGFDEAVTIGTAADPPVASSFLVKAAAIPLLFPLRVKKLYAKCGGSDTATLHVLAIF